MPYGAALLVWGLASPRPEAVCVHLLSVKPCAPGTNKQHSNDVVYEDVEPTRENIKNHSKFKYNGFYKVASFVVELRLDSCFVALGRLLAVFGV